MNRKEMRGCLRRKLKGIDFLDYSQLALGFHCKIERPLANRMAEATGMGASMDLLAGLIPLLQFHAKRLSNVDPGQSEGFLSHVGGLALPALVPFVVLVLNNELYVTSKALMPWK